MASASVTIGPYVAGEKPPPLQYTFTDSSGTAIDLTGYDVQFHVQRTDAVASTYDGTLTDGPTGTVSYTWTGTEFVTSGKYWAEFWVGNGVNLFASLRLEFTVRAAVGTAPAI